MDTADGWVGRCEFCEREGVHGAGIHGGVKKGVGVLELEIILVETAFPACAVDAYDAAGGSRREQRQEVLDEAHADVVTERDCIFQSVCVVCRVRSQIFPILCFSRFRWCN